MKLPRTRHGAFILLSWLLYVQPVSAQAVSFNPTYSRFPITGSRAMQQAAVSDKAPQPVQVFDDVAVLSRLGRINSFGTPNVTATAANTPDLNYQPTSLASTAANVNPYYVTSLNPLTTNEHYLRPDPPARAASATTTAAPIVNPRLNNLLSLTPRTTPLTVTSAASAVRFSGINAFIPQAPTRGANTAPIPNIGIIVGVPEPTTLVMLLSIVLMIGYGYLRQRWKAQTQLAEEKQIDLSLPQESLPKAS